MNPSLHPDTFRTLLTYKQPNKQPQPSNNPMIVNKMIFCTDTSTVTVSSFVCIPL